MCHAGGSRIIKFTKCLQGNRVNGPEPFWSLVFRSSTKSLKEHVKRFREVYFNSAKLYEGPPEEPVRSQCAKVRLKLSHLQGAYSPIHTEDRPSAAGYSECDLELAKTGK